MPPIPEILKPKPTVEVVYAGGTILSLATTQGYREGGHVVDLVGLLEQHIPDFKDKVTLGNIDVAYTGLSENIDERYLEQIGEKVGNALGRSPRSVIVTHGTDSMEQTARALQARFGDELKTKKAKIILTGANDDISAPNTDAWDNLAFAFESTSSDAEPGVYVALHHKLIPADLVVKEPFNGVAMNYASSNDPAYQEAVRKQRERSQLLINELEASYGRKAEGTGVVDYPVNVVRPSHQELLDYIEANDVRAVLLTLYHSGTANTETPKLSIAELANKLSNERGVFCFAVTENGEPVNFGGYETSVKLHEAGIVPLGNMLHDVALAKLRLTSTSVSGDDLIGEMQTNRVGEIG